MKIKNVLDGEKTEIEWPKPSPPKTGATVGERVEYSLAEAVRRFFSLFDEPLAELLSIPFRLLIKIVEKSTAGYMAPVIDQALESMDADDPFAKLLLRLRQPTEEGGLALLAGMGSSAGAAGLMSVFEPAFERWRQNAYLGDPTKLPDPMTQMLIYSRGQMSDVRRDEWFQRMGYSKEFWPFVWSVVRPRPTDGDIGRMVQREIMTPEEYKEELQARGLSTDETDLLEEMLHLIPGPGDLIRMAVREAFTPEVIDRFQLGAEFPTEVKTWLKKQGYDEEWARRWWYAHWDLPSVQMGFEMLHRGVIDAGQLNLLLRTLDISPWWREKLTEISYHPYTRVDTRRMYDEGILNEEDVYRAYLDQGYDSERAQNMTAFTIALSQEDARSESKGDIITAYVEGTVDRGKAKDLLTDLGYDDIFCEAYLLKADYTIERNLRLREEKVEEEEIEEERKASKADVVTSYEIGVYNYNEALTMLQNLGYASDLADAFLFKVEYRRAQKMIAETIDTTKELYVNEEIQVSQVHERLGTLALPSTQIDELLVLWSIAREKRTARPSRGELVRFYLRGRFDDVVLRAQLAKHKLSSEYIEWYVGDANQTILENERKEIERLMKEQEREAQSAFQSERRMTLNRIDILIQERRVYAAELKVLAMDVEAPDILIQIKRELTENTAEIQRLRLSKLEYPIERLIEGGM